MAKDLSHNDWVLQQFDKYLRKQYRDVLIHASIIEGVLVKESGEKSFNKANKKLLFSEKINSFEFCIFNQLRDLRNTLVHDSFKDKLVQNDIDNLRDLLMDKICEAYRVSPFLNRKLFEVYQIKRSSKIKFRS